MSLPTISLEQAIDLLKSDEVVAIPTETVYGLAASTTSEIALNKIFSTKDRPFFDPLIVHISSIENAKKLTSHWNKYHEALAKHLWPGPLTMIVAKNSKVSPLITSGLESVGLRCPNHSLTLKLLQAFPEGLAAPSANKFGKTSPTESKHVFQEFGDRVKILEGGPCHVGIESTILEVIDEKIIKIYRPGIITKNKIEAILKIENLPLIEIIYDQSPVAPGQLKHHYMPKIPLIITTDSNYESEYTKPFHWRLPADPIIAARVLYQNMRDIDPLHDAIILFKDFDHTNENWLGIWNRLQKAASRII
jgi:L-threonylcarbamoyladenylate synthase